MHRLRRFRPEAEHLDPRTLPATFGVPWPDPQSLDLDGAGVLASRRGPPQGLYSPAHTYMMEGCRARPSRLFGSEPLMGRARAPLSVGHCAVLPLKEE